MKSKALKINRYLWYAFITVFVIVVLVYVLQ